MTKEEIEKSSQRLMQRPAPPVVKDSVELSPRIVRDKSEIDKSVERLYTVAVEQKKKKLEESEKAQTAKDQPKTVVRTQEEVEEGVQRLYNQSLENMQNSKKKSEERFRFKARSPSPTMPNAERNKRLYTDSLQKKKETHDALFEKYIVATDVKSRKLTAEELKASADRLSAKK